MAYTISMPEKASMQISASYAAVIKDASAYLQKPPTTKTENATASANSASTVTLSQEGKDQAYKVDNLKVIAVTQLTQVTDPAVLAELKSRIDEVNQQMTSFYSEKNVQEMADRLQSQGNEHQTAVIKLDGKVVGSFSASGSYFTQNAMGSLVSSAEGDQNAMANILKQKYGNRIEIQHYAQGQGPTFAQLEKSLYGTDYFARAAESVANFRAEAADWRRNNSAA